MSGYWVVYFAVLAGFVLAGFCWSRAARQSLLLLVPGLYALAGTLVFIRISGDEFDWRLPALFGGLFYAAGLGAGAAVDPALRRDMAAAFRSLRRLDWLDRKRRQLYGVVLFGLGLLLLGVHFYRNRALGGGLGATDFLGFYSAAHLVRGLIPTDAYRDPLLFTTERGFVPDLRVPIGFLYPPIFLLPLTLLAKLGYLQAFLAWTAARLALYAAALRGVLRAEGLPWLLMAAPAVFLDLQSGQNGLLSAAILAGGTLWLERRPFLAGLILGALCYKPQLALLIPVALVAGGHWRALLGALLAAALLTFISWIAFGNHVWHIFLLRVSYAPALFAGGRVAFDQGAGVLATLRGFGADLVPAGIAQAVASAAAAIAVAVVWFRKLPMSVQAPVLIAATLVADPVAMFYDLALCGVALAWIWRDGRERGWRDGEKLVLLALFVWPEIAVFVLYNWHLPVWILTSLGLLALALNRAWWLVVPRPRGV